MTLFIQKQLNNFHTWNPKFKKTKRKWWIAYNEAIKQKEIQQIMVRLLKNKLTRCFSQLFSIFRMNFNPTLFRTAGNQINYLKHQVFQNKDEFKKLSKHLISKFEKNQSVIIETQHLYKNHSSRFRLNKECLLMFPYL